MKRREFIAGLGASATWPLAARAQQSGKLPTIGFLGTGTPSAMNQWVLAFLERLRELGWIEGRTVAIEYRWAEGHSERYDEIAAEFIRLKVDVIFTTVPAVATLKQATSVIPIVFALGTDPVGGGLVASLARPGGNVTGLSMQATDLAGKRIELLGEVVPHLKRLAVLGNVDIPPKSCWRCRRLMSRPKNSVSKSLHWRYVERMILDLPSRRSKATPKPCMSVLTRYQSSVGSR
jgi:putative ABC transport system substrate-binding protein